MRIINPTQKTVIAENFKIADTFFSRFIGLLNRRSLESGEALIITRCQSIHMFFMRFTIDAVFIDRNDKVVGLVERIKPWRLSPVFFKADRVIELPEGVIDLSKTSLGDQLIIKE